jgi:serine/threonine protein kinase
MRVGNRYELLSRLGQGGMGTVWRAHDELLGRDVAIKEVLLPPELGEDERGARHARTIREARSAARLNHPGAVTVHDVIEDEGRPWIVMELVSAPSLQSVIDGEGPLAPQRVAALGRQTLAALRAAHAAGIVHRDIKPSNVLVADGDRAVVTDFGIAALEGDATLTGTGVLIGSPAYIAPERARGERAGPAGDLWSLGATLYAAVEGRSPFERSGPVSTIAAIIAEDAPPPRHAGPLAPVLAGLLRRDPADRMTAAEADRMLAQVIAGTLPDVAGRPLAMPRTPTQPAVAAHEKTTRSTMIAPPPEPAAPARGNGLLMLAGALAGALVITAFGAVWLLGRTSARQTPAAASSAATAPTNRPELNRTSPLIGRNSARTSSPTTDADQSSSVPAASPPDNWATKNEDGFSISVPSSWRRHSDGDNVFYQDQSTRYLLQVGTTPWNSDPQTEARSASNDIARSFSGYRESSITPTTYLGVPAADLEFAYDRSTGTERAIDRFFQVGGRSYAIFFRMPADQWAASSPAYLDAIFGGFHAG